MSGFASYDVRLTHSSLGHIHSFLNIISNTAKAGFVVPDINAAMILRASPDHSFLEWMEILSKHQQGKMWEEK